MLCDGARRLEHSGTRVRRRSDAGRRNLALVGRRRILFSARQGRGYYDRTLAQFDPSPKGIGVGFSNYLIPTIFPMPLDIPIDSVALSEGSVRDRLSTRP